MRSHLRISGLLGSVCVLFCLGFSPQFRAFAASPPAQDHGLLREVYLGTDSSLSSLLNLATYPDNPNTSEIYSNDFETPTDTADNYGQRMRGYIVPPTTGNYTFWIASDDNSELWLSTDDQPAHKVRIAYVGGWTSPREWTKEASQQSAPVALQAGRAYYIEALMTEGGGGDNLAARWQLPDGTFEEPIPAARLYPWGTSFSAPVIAQQPANTTAIENESAVFQVTLSGIGSASFQWQRNGIDIPGGVFASYTNSAVPLADDGALFRCLVSNSLGSVTSAEAVLTVKPDTTAPFITGVQNHGRTSLTLAFSESVQTASAANAGNYGINQGVEVTAAVPGADGKTVVLTTSSMTFGSNYVLSVANVLDRAVTPNPVDSNTRVPFAVTEYAPQDIGAAGSVGGVQTVPGGFAVSGGGDIGGGGDRFQFAYQQRSGNFDVTVRVQSLDQTDALAKAGLMARETLQSNSRFASILATPSFQGAFFEYRDTAGGAAAVTGSFPANFPNQWLRLQRSGNVFTGYASFDGRVWATLGSVTLSMPATLYFGMAVSGNASNKAATAQFRDLGTTSNAVAGVVTSPVEPLGPSSRKTGLALTEIMYKPAPRDDGKNLEFVELYNSNPYFEDISGYRLSGDVDYSFPAGTVLPGGAFLVVAKSPDDIRTVYGISNVQGPYAHSLKPSGKVELLNNQDAIYLSVSYDNEYPWPAGADGTGHSLTLVRPSLGEGDARAWDISDAVGGSPGTSDAFRPSPLRSVFINEFLASTIPPQLDSIELYNHSIQAVDLSGCILTDNAGTNKFIIPQGVSIPARGFLAFDETQLGFALSASGGSIYFINPDGSRVLDDVRYDAQAQGISMSRHPDGASAFYPLKASTLGAVNSDILVSEIAINEIMYKPVSDDANDEYVELMNWGAAAKNVSGWRFTQGINFTLPPGTIIPANGYLVIAKSATNLLAHYPHLHSGNTVGDFKGSLSGKGERLVLSRPEEHVTINSSGESVTNMLYVAVDEVDYKSGGRWGKWSSSGGSSLELIDPRSDHRLPSNWADSDETAKAPWTVIEATGPMDNGAGSAKYLEVSLSGEGECLVDDIELFKAGGANLVSNPGFESGMTDWTIRGNHIRSSLETASGFGGYNSGQSLHIRASSRGDYGANRILTRLTTVPSGTVTIRAKVRWLRGFPEIILRLHGAYMEATGRLSVPVNCGTPGVINGRFAPNAGPAIYDLATSPVLPSAGQPMIVTARAQDPDGIASFNLKYRVDPSPNYVTVAMKDDGLGGDAVAGDGLFTATIPGQSSGALVAFLLTAADNASTSTLFPAGASTSGRECLVRFGEEKLKSAFATYRMWFTQKAINDWINRPVLSNEPVEGTFVYGDIRPIYNIGVRYAGSPYHQGFDSPVGGGCHYSIDMPLDDLVLGTDYFNKLHGPGNGAFDDNTIQREQTAYWMARQLKIPWLYRRYVQVYVNGSRRGPLMEDMQTPSGDVIDEYFPNDTDGRLYKLQPWFEMDDAATGSMNFQNNSWCTLNKFTTTINGVPGQHKLARYRWNYLTRASHGTGNNYTNVYDLIDAANSTAKGDAYAAVMQNVADMEEWMRVTALSHACGNWDSFGAQNEQNMYGYKPQFSPWKLIIFDFNIVLGNSGSWGPGTNNLFTYNGADPLWGKIYSTPVFRRAYLRTFKELAMGALIDTNVGPVMDAKYAAFSASGINVTSPGGVKSWIATMRNSLMDALKSEGANSAFAIAGSGTVNSASSMVTLTGQAPVEIKTLKVNGVVWPVSWTSVSAWSLRVPVGPATTTLNIQGFDSQGAPVASASGTVTVNYTGVVELPENFLAINEILYHPAAANTEYVELFNRSSGTTYDLSNWRLEGINFTFPDGTTLTPQSYLLVVKDRLAFQAAYGKSLPIAGEYAGTLSSNGETLRLVKPGATSDADQVIDEVTYDSQPPWPAEADGLGSSLQLIDATRDNGRAGNWAALPPGGAGSRTPGAANAVKASLDPFPPLWINEAMPENVAGPVDSQGRHGSWLEIYNDSVNPVDLGGLYLSDNHTNLTQWAFAPGTIVGSNGFLVVWMDGNASSPAEPHASFKLPPGSGSVVLSRIQNGQAAVVDYLNYAGILPDYSYGSNPDGRSKQLRTFYYPTPGAINNPAPAPALVSINEWMASNTRTLVDGADGLYQDWFELFNAGANAVDLGGFTITDDALMPAKFVVPRGFSMPAMGRLLVWADNETGQNTMSSEELHVNFKLAREGGSLALRDPDGRILDEVIYGLQTNDVSQGRYPDGGASLFYMDYPTPGAMNLVASSNLPPVLEPIGSRTVLEGETLSFIARGSDPDASSVLSYSLGAGAPAGAAIDGVTGEFRWTPTPSQGPASYPILVRVTDNGNPPLTATERVMVTVTEINTAPVLAVIQDGIIVEGQKLSFTASAVDNDLPPQALTYSLDSGAPAGASIDPKTGLFNWTPAEDQGPGTFAITVRATDHGIPALSDAKGFTVIVMETNSAPVLTTIPDQSIVQGQALVLTAPATDSDVPVQKLAYSLDPGAPAGMTINPVTGLITWPPNAALVTGVYPVTVRATDNGTPAMRDAKSFSVTVKSNSPWQFVTVTGTASSSSLYVYLTSAGDLYLDDMKLVSGRIAEAGTNLLANGDFESALTGSWTVSANHARSAIIDKPTHSGKASLHVVATTGGTTRSSSIWQDITPALVNNADYTLSFWCLPGTNATTLTMRLSGSGISVTTDVVPVKNTAPVLAAISDQSISSGQELSFNITATDIDVPAQTLTYFMDAGAPAGASLNPATGLFTWKPDASQIPSAYKITMWATDNGNPPQSDAKTFQVVTTGISETIVIHEIHRAADGTVTLSWSSTDGGVYQVLLKQNLDDETWEPLGEITATGPVSSLAREISDLKQCFLIVQRVR